MRLNHKVVMFTLYLGMALAASKTNAQTLGTAGAFNVYVIGNDTQYGTDAQGRVAVGGNANFSQNGQGYTINSHNVGGGSGIVVGGSYSNSSNTLSGGATINGSATFSNPSITGDVNVNGSLTFSNYGTETGNVRVGGSYSNPNTAVSGSVTYATTVMPFDFTTVSNDLKAKSTYYSTLTANGTTTNYYNGLTLAGSSNSLNIFNVRGSDLNSATSFTVNAPTGSTILINIDGTTDQMVNFGMSINGTDKQKVLYNFFQATALTLTGVGIQGSVLAPLAAVNFAGGNIDGTMIAGSLSGIGESHDYLFNGSLPVNSSQGVPEPGMTALFGSALLVGGIAFRRLRQK